MSKSKKNLSKAHIAYLLIFLVSSVLTASFHFVNEAWETSSFQASVTDRHPGLIDCSSSLFCYRLLIPHSIEFFHQFSGLPLQYCYDFYHLIFMFLTLFFFFKFLSKYLSFSYSLLGVFLLSSLYPITFNIIEATDIFVLFLFSFTTYLLISDLKFRNPLMILSLLIGTFAKDVTLFILFAFVVFHYLEFKKDKRNSHIYWIILGFSAFLIPYSLLRLTFGTFPYSFTILHNIFAFKAIILFILSIGIISLLSLQNFKNKPSSFKIFTAEYLLYLFAMLAVGNIDETRIFLPVLIIFIPQLLINLKEKFGN